MALRNITKENFVFDFDNILQTFNPEKKWNLSEAHPSMNNDLRLSAKRQTLAIRSRKIIKGDRRSLGLPQICESPTNSTDMIVRQESPWDTYRRIAVLEIGGQVIIAVDLSRSSRMRTFREYARADTEQLLHYFRNSDNPNILCAQECYLDQSSMYALVDHLPLTLNDLVRCRSLYPTEAELASIISQVCFSSTIIVPIS